MTKNSNSETESLKSSVSQFTSSKLISLFEISGEHRDISASHCAGFN